MKHLTQDQHTVRQAIISGEIHSQKVVEAFDREMAEYKKEEALRRLRRAGRMPRSRRTV